MHRLESLELMSHRILRGRLKGERRSQRKGQSVEFADYRNYVVGDDLRFIDWNTYARLDRLFIKLFQEEEDLHFYVLVDDSESMNFGRPTKLYYAKQVAAALGFIALVHSDRVCVETFQQPAAQRSVPLRGRPALWRLLRRAESIEPVASQYSMAESVKNFCLRHPRTGVVIVCSDLLDKQGYEEALRLLIARRFEVYVIQTLSPEELNPELAGDLKLVDAEDADVAEVTASRPLLERYRKTLNAFVGGIRSYCARRGITYLLANTGEPFEPLITTYLRQRGLVK